MEGVGAPNFFEMSLVRDRATGGGHAFFGVGFF